MNSRVVIVAVIGALVGAAACGGGGHPRATDAPTTTVPRDRNPAYGHPGPFPVGYAVVRTHSRPVAVFYPGTVGSEKDLDHATYDIRAAAHDPTAKPLDRDDSQLVELPAYGDLPVATGTFPVVLFSHDSGGFPQQSSNVMAQIAAWGFVVIAPDHVERDAFRASVQSATVDDMRDATVLTTALTDIAGDPTFAPSLDLSHVAAVGDGQGGATALMALARSQVSAAVALASVPPPRAVAIKPVLLVGAAKDHEDGTSVQQAVYDNLEGPKRLVLLGGGAGHATFLDNCALMHAAGNLVAGGDVIDPDDPGGPVELSLNGCYPDELEPQRAWPVAAHFTVAFLRSTFGIDPEPVGLGDAIAHAFPNVPLTYQQSP